MLPRSADLPIKAYLRLPTLRDCGHGSSEDIRCFAVQADSLNRTFQLLHRRLPRSRLGDIFIFCHGLSMLKASAVGIPTGPVLHSRLPAIPSHRVEHVNRRVACLWCKPNDLEPANAEANTDIPDLSLRIQDHVSHPS